MTRALVTGSTGMLGSAMVAYLDAHGVETHRVTLRGGTPLAEEVDPRAPDDMVRLLERVRPTHVLHLSGALQAGNVSDVIAANALHGAMLVDAVARSGIDAVTLVVGSAAEYGPLAPDEEAAEETRQAAPTSLYGAAKLAQSVAALASGVPVVVTRPSNMVGLGMPETLALGRFAAELARARRAGGSLRLKVGDLSAVRDFIDVQDAARIMWTLAQTPGAVGQVVNVATGSGITIGKALDLLAEAFAVEVHPVSSGPSSSRSAAAARFVASTRRLEELIGQQSLTPLTQTFSRIAVHCCTAGASNDASLT